MMDIWPIPSRKAARNLWYRVPTEWEQQIEKDIQTIISDCAVNQSHAVCLAIHDLAETIRWDNDCSNRASV